MEEATAGLTATARRIGALGGPIDLALSGGKDSRLLAAAFFEAGVEARLHTRAVYDDEAAIAVELVRRLGPGRVRHDIVGHGDTAAASPSRTSRSTRSRARATSSPSRAGSTTRSMSASSTPAASARRG